MKKRPAEEAMYMVESKIERKSSEEQLQMLQNRLSQLAREEEKALKKMSETKRRTDMFIRARQDHEKDVER